MKKLMFTIILVCMITAAASGAKDKMRTAVLDLQAKGVPKITAEAVTNLLRSDFVDSGDFTVVERSQMGEILKEQGFQQTGCTDSSCAVKVGKLLSAQKILIGEVTRLGNNIFITVRIVDIEKGVAEYSAREKAESTEVIDEAVRKLSIRLIGRITGKSGSELFAEKRPAGFYTRGIVPGWAQFYAGKRTRGFVYSGTFAAAAGFTVFSAIKYNKMQQEYDDLPYGTSESVFDEKDRDQKTWGIITLASVCTVSLVYAMNWVDIIFLTGNDFKSAGLLDPENSIYITLVARVWDETVKMPDRGIVMGLTRRF